jgi:hypothetical protein
LLLAIGLHELTPYAWLSYNGEFGGILFLGFMFIGGAAILLAGFTSITFNTVSGTIERKSPIGLGNKTYSFKDYTGLQTVRKTVNLIYAGTDILLYFDIPGKNKQEAMQLSSFRKSRNIERFVNEVYSIINSKKI